MFWWKSLLRISSVKWWYLSDVSDDLSLITFIFPCHEINLCSSDSQTLPFLKEFNWDMYCLHQICTKLLSWILDVYFLLLLWTGFFCNLTLTTSKTKSLYIKSTHTRKRESIFRYFQSLTTLFLCSHKISIFV